MPTKQDVLDALRIIIDPDFNKDIVSLGFVKNIKIDGEKVSLDIELTTPACPIKSEFQRQAEIVVTALDGVKNAAIRMTSKKRTRPSANENSTLQTVQSIIAISSCKGGVGKSTITAQIAQALAYRGHKVGIVDADIHGPSIPSLFNLKKPEVYTNEKKQFIPIEKNNLKIMSFGFLLGDGPAVMRGPMVSQYVQQIMHNTAWGELDYLFVDMPPGTGDIQLTITQTARLNGAVIVTTPQTLSLIDVTRGILMFEKVNVPILGLIENMSYFLCDQCEKKHYIFGNPSHHTFQDRFGIDLLAELPLLQQMTLPIDEPVSNEFIAQAVDNVVMALGKSTIAENQAPDIQFDNKHTTLHWPDGRQLSVSHRDLRLSCQCALCINEMTGEKILKESSIKDDIAPKEAFPLGNYAIGITWNDGHSSGIYTYKNIRQLAGVAVSESEE